METLARTWELMTESFAVLSRDKKLILFPVLSTLALIAMDFPFVLGVAGIVQYTSSSDRYAIMFLFYWANCVVIIFFNSALMACASISLTGGSPTLADGFRAAGSRFGRIVLWSIIAGTVGFVLGTFRRRGGLLERLVFYILGVAWWMATYFIIPVIILEDLDVFGSFKRSSELFRQQWGEEVVSNFSFRVLSFLLVFLPAIVLLVLAARVFGGTGALVGGVVSLAYLAVMFHVVAAAQGIFTVALYHFASDGQIGPGFAPELLQSAFSGTALVPSKYQEMAQGRLAAPRARGPRPSHAAPNLIVPGQSVGLVTLGMPVEEVITFLDIPKSTKSEPDGSVRYSWMDSPGDDGLSVRASHDGLVYEIVAANDARYATREGVRVGSTVDDVIRALGAPSRIEPHPQERTKSVQYDSLGVSLDLDLKPQARFFNAVFRITVVTPR